MNIDKNLKYGTGLAMNSKFLCMVCGNHNVNMVPELMDERKMYCSKCLGYTSVNSIEKVQ
jgi:late competence protein required for DNA uptake (superfamily II DNA/RNA helicase)